MRIWVYKVVRTEAEKKHSLVPARKELVCSGEVVSTSPNLNRYGYGVSGGIPDNAVLLELSDGNVVITAK